MKRIDRFLHFGFKVVKRTNGQNGSPLPNMEQYYLTNDQGGSLSFWNDIPIGFKGDMVTSCIQIPKEKCAKLQVAKDIKYHPFMQDTKKNLFTKQLQLRYYAQFPLFNYGFIPQTWEQNLTKDALGLYGDDDPIDICDLSEGRKQVGSIFQAKVLGSFCLIDQGQVDWKVLVLDAKQAERQGIKDISHYSKTRLQAVMNWFKGIKVFEGKKANQIAYNQKIFNRDETLGIIHETHTEWKKLISSPEAVYSKLRKDYHLQGVKI